MTEYQMMTSPDEWVHWPYLPLKKRVEGNTGLVLGVLMEVSDNVYQFAEGVIFKKEDREWRTVNPQELINEGWVVD